MLFIVRFCAHSEKAWSTQDLAWFLSPECSGRKSVGLITLSYAPRANKKYKKQKNKQTNKTKQKAQSNYIAILITKNLRTRPGAGLEPSDTS